MTADGQQLSGFGPRIVIENGGHVVEAMKRTAAELSRDNMALTALVTEWATVTRRLIT
jgi:hypothetical protein